jgi:DNA-binding CsgD family transcriptional regulator/PAS domain-containing protein
MDDALSADALLTLIGSIYDCAIDPSCWDQTLTELRKAFQTQTALIGLTNVSNNDTLIFKIVGMEPYWLQQLMKYAPEINEFTMKAIAELPSLDEPQVLSRHVPLATRAASPYVRECLNPQGLVDILQYILLFSRTRLAVFGVGRHERHGLITDRELALGNLLLPHIRRAVMISNILDVKTIERSRMAEALDALRCGVVLTNALGRVLHTNKSAEHMLRKGDPVRCSTGFLQAKSWSAAAELRTAIDLAARNEANIGKTGLAIRLTDAELPAVFAHVLPLTGSDLRTQLQPEAVAAVFIGGANDGQDGAVVAAAVYGLTPAETRILASLLAGRTLDETSAALGIARATAKTHLDSIFSKTGVARQADLMRLAAKLVPPTGST